MNPANLRTPGALDLGVCQMDLGLCEYYTENKQKAKEYWEKNLEFVA
jgi:hypothetical protein